MITSLPITEADILNEIIEPGHSRFTRQVAEEFLSLCFNESARERIRELLRKNNAGLISETEQTTLQNLCWSCDLCNGFKGSDVSAYIADTEELTRLFNPRLDVWGQHFE